MTEYNRRWTAFGIRKHLCILWWWNGNPLRAAWRWLRGLDPWYSRCSRTVEISTRTTPRNQDECYCPTGCTSEFRVQFFTIGVWGWLSRDWTVRPCWCERAIHEWTVRIDAREFARSNPA